MKILQVVAGLEEGGIERGTVEMDHYISAQGAEGFVASAGGRMVAELSGTHFPLPLTRKTPWHVLYSAWQVSQVIQDQKIDLVVGRSRIPCWAAYLACLRTKTPFVTVFHGTHKIQNGLKRWYNSSPTKGARVIAVSEFIKRHLMDRYGVSGKKIDVARRGADLKFFAPDQFRSSQLEKLKTELELPLNVPLLNLSGRISPWKGQDVFLDLLSQVKDLPWAAMIVGGAGKKQSLLDDLKNQAARLGIADRIRFLGSRKDMPALYLMSDLAFSLSKQPEAFGRVAVEAQAMGTPVFATALGGSLETIIDGETGFLVDPTDIDSMAKILRGALENPQKLQEMGDKARQHCHTHLSTQNMCAAEWQTYMAVLNASKKDFI